jgi:hypothetical protein
MFATDNDDTDMTHETARGVSLDTLARLRKTLRIRAMRWVNVPGVERHAG